MDEPAICLTRNSDFINMNPQEKQSVLANFFPEFGTLNAGEFQSALVELKGAIDAWDEESKKVGASELTDNLWQQIQDTEHPTHPWSSKVGKADRLVPIPPGAVIDPAPQTTEKRSKKPQFNPKAQTPVSTAKSDWFAQFGGKARSQNCENNAFFAKFGGKADCATAPIPVTPEKPR
jgi:hypothetical protein